MSILFPNNPSANQIFSVGTKSWTWNGYAWDMVTANTTNILAQSIIAISNAQNAANIANSALPNTGNLISVNSSSILLISNTTQATSTSSGALIVNGGVGVSGNVYIGSSIIANNGLYSNNNYNGTYSDGIVVDYLSGNGRISVGSGDGITFYNGGVASSQLANITNSGIFNSVGAVITGTSPGISFSVNIPSLFNGTQTWIFGTQTDVGNPNPSYIRFPDGTYQYSAYYGLSDPYNTANAAYNVANNAWSGANAAYTYASSTANNAYGTANAAWAQANSEPKGTAAYATANAAWAQANSEPKGTAAYAVANAAWAGANAAYTYASSTANNAYATANAAWASSNTKFSSSGGSISGAVTINSTLTVTGNVYFGGNVTTINANNLAIQDNMIYLNSSSNVANPDLGFAGNYNDGTYRHAGFFRKASDGIWRVFDQYVPEPDNSPYIDTSNSTFRIADFQANNVYFGAIYTSSNALVANLNSSLLNSQPASYYTGLSISSYSQANTANGTANIALTNAGNAYNTANIAWTVANNAYLTANAAYNKSNSTFLIGNTTLFLGSSNSSLSGLNNIVSNNIILTGNIPSNNISSGSFVVYGGMGISGNVYFGSNVYSNVISTYPQGSNTNLIIDPDGYGNVIFTQQTEIFIQSNTASVNSTSGALVISGGLGVSGDVNVLGNTNINGTLTATDVYSPSDISLKENIKPISNSIQIINSINPVEFSWKNTKRKSYGVIAQEIEKVLPELVNENNGLKSVEYQALIGFLIDITKNQEKRISELEYKINSSINHK